MSEREIGVEAARAKLGDLVDDAALDGVTTYLTRRGRRHAAIVPLSLVKETRMNNTAVWSVVRGQSPTAQAVDPGIAGVDIPAEVLAWAETNGLDVNDPDVYLLVAPQDEACEVSSEIAYMTTAVSANDMARIQASLNQE